MIGATDRGKIPIGDWRRGRSNQPMLFHKWNTNVINKPGLPIEGRKKPISEMYWGVYVLGLRIPLTMRI